MVVFGSAGVFKAKNHTDNIDSVTLGNIGTNSALVKQFMSDCDIFVVE